MVLCQSQKGRHCGGRMRINCLWADKPIYTGSIDGTSAFDCNFLSTDAYYYHVSLSSIRIKQTDQFDRYCVCRRRKPADKEGLEVGSNRQESLLQQANTVSRINFDIMTSTMNTKYQETTYMNASVGNGHYGQNYEKLKLPELTSQSVVLRTELGEAYYGAVYLADVLPNLLYSPNHPCAAKVSRTWNWNWKTNRTVSDIEWKYKHEASSPVLAWDGDALWNASWSYC